MSEQEYLDYQERLSHRLKKLKPYEDFVRERLEACQEASAAQVHDWLKECQPDFKKVSTKTVYNFVLYVREKYRLPKVFAAQEFCKVPELPYGQQAQVDFGEYNMTNSDGQRKKVYFFALVLSRSPYKFVLFSESPFTTATASTSSCSLKSTNIHEQIECPCYLLRLLLKLIVMKKVSFSCDWPSIHD